MNYHGLRILHLATVDFTVKQFVVPIMRHQREQGASVAAACAPGEYFRQLQSDGITMHPLPMQRELRPLGQAKAAWELVNLLKRERPHVLHCHTPIAGLLGRWAGKVAGVPRRLYTVHGFHFHDGSSPAARAAFIALERLGAIAGHDLLFVSREDLEAAKTIGLAARETLHFTGNGVPVAAIRRAASQPPKTREQLGIPPDALVVGFVGRMVSEKGLPELLEAVGQLLGEGYPLHLLLVGGRLQSDPTRGIGDWERRLDEEPFRGRVTRTGLVPSAWPWLGLMDTFVLPSHREGMPVSLMEAMAAGLPCVATRIRGSRELIQSGLNGLLVPPKDAGALTTALRWIAQASRQERAELGEAGHASIWRSGFDEAAWHGRIDRAYGAACGGLVR